MFLQIQDWFIVYQLKDKNTWTLPALFFIILVPITLFITVKMLMPSNESDKRTDMKKYYCSQYGVIFFIVGIAVLISILFNVFLLHKTWLQQALLLVFFILIMCISLKKVENELKHKCLALPIVAVLSFVCNFRTFAIKRTIAVDIF